MGRKISVICALVSLIIITYVYLGQPEIDFLTDTISETEVVTNGALKLNEYASAQVISSKKDHPFQIGCAVPDTQAARENAAFVVLARNSELQGVLRSMGSLERHFNRRYNYPWVILNEEPFDEAFKDAVRKATTAEVEFGLIDKTVWDFDPAVDQSQIKAYIQSQGDREVMYGNLESYHKMCRFFSGAFYKHELVQKREWYWRVEPDVEFFCDLTYDPFVQMKKHGKKYGFTVSLSELYYTVPNLFRETRAFIRANSVDVKSAWSLFIDDFNLVKGENSEKYAHLSSRKEILSEIEKDIMLDSFLQMKKKKNNHVESLSPKLKHKLFKEMGNRPTIHSDRFDGEEYNMCHFWSNFEIARTDIFNSPLYEAYFKHLDNSGGFYKERWGDAPVHSLAMGMLLDVEEIHYFRDIGYQHSNIAHCPRNAPVNQLHFDYKPKTKEDRYWQRPDFPQENGIGCRCRCPKGHMDIEDSVQSCIRKWSEVASDNFRAFEVVDVGHWEKIIGEMIQSYLATGGQEGGDAGIVDKLEFNS